MADQLREICETYRQRVHRFLDVLDKARGLEGEINDRLELSSPYRIITDEEERTVRDDLCQPLLIPVIGERNSGKSSLINELLQSDVVTVADTACTSRIVRVKYSEEPYYQVVHKDGHVKAGSRKQLAGSADSYGTALRDVTVLQGDERYSTLVSEVVEVGINHPLLACGVEFLDSPGRNENAELDKVVDKITEMELPILIYVIDGNMLLRPSDRATIQFFKEKCPKTTILYVCSKVDVDKRAEYMDAASDDDEEDELQPSFSQLSIIDKGSRVKEDLLRHSILDQQSLHSFHALSVREVRRSRRMKTGNINCRFSLTFQQFKTDLATATRKHFEGGVIRAVDSLSKYNSRCFYAFALKHTEMEEESDEMTGILSKARQLEREVYSKVNHIVETIRSDLKGILSSAVQCAAERVAGANLSRMPSVFAYDNILSEPDIKRQFGSRIPEGDDFLMLHTLCHEVRNLIVNEICRKVETQFERVLEGKLPQSAHLQFEEATTLLHHPILQRNLENIYQMAGEDSSFSQSATSAMSELLYSLLELVKITTIVELHETYSSALMVETAITFFRPSLRHTVGDTAHVIAKTLASLLNANNVTDRIIQILRDYIRDKHEKYLGMIEEMDTCKDGVTVQKDEHHAITVSLITSKLGQVEVRNLGLKYELTRGKLTTGEELNRGQNSRIRIGGPGWKLPTEHVVRVINNESCGWKQNLCSLYYARNCVSSDHLIKLYGWTFPSPDEVHIAMEKAEGSLDKLELSPRQRLSIMLDVVRGIEVIHSSGYIYHNLKAKNVLVTSNKRAKINTCKGDYEVLHGQAANLDIQQVGELLLSLYRPELTDSELKSLMDASRPHDIDENIWSLIERCTAKHKLITVNDIIEELNRLLGSF
ncbi:dual serine/threonine and tyrosine protein kinase-like [Ptychodera flava]|uniref:dual serine/threonine and tyrosine protein kinase-like n=1 Tax=Ptychodera flava TaxID=63121 RepID=UPI00396A0D3D